MAGESWWSRRAGVSPVLGLALAGAALAAALLAGRAQPSDSSVDPVPTGSPRPASFAVAYHGCLRGERLGENLALSEDGHVLAYGVDWWYEVSRRNPLGELYGTRGPLLDCVLLALRAPAGTRSAMDGTRASDGVVAADWPGVHAAWRHDTERGITATFTAVG